MSIVLPSKFKDEFGFKHRALRKLCREAVKFNEGHLKGNGGVYKEKTVSLFIKGSRFRETYLFFVVVSFLLALKLPSAVSSGKKSKQKTPRLRLML